LELGRNLHWEIARLLAAQDAIDMTPVFATSLRDKFVKSANRVFSHQALASRSGGQWSQHHLR
jgi:hypothetical protein